jgi:hypothetical protein
MKKRYHRRWHALNGRVCARMQLRERSAADGSLRRDPAQAHQLFGVPRFLFRELKNECRGWLRAIGRNNPAETFAREVEARHLLAYIAERRRRSAPRGSASAAAAVRGSADANAVQRGGTSGPGSASEGGAMTRPRLALANLIIFGLLAGSGYDIVTDQEHWPFSQYPMFAAVETSWTHRGLRLFGVTPSGAEVALLDNDHLAPFDQCRLAAAFRRLRTEARDEKRLHAALRDCFERYRVTSDQDPAGHPPLNAVRLYELDWRLDKNADNARTPDQRRLVAEYAPTEP